MKEAPHTTSQARSPPSGAGDWSTASLSVAASVSAVESFSVKSLAFDSSFASGRVSWPSIFVHESFMVAEMKYSFGWLVPAVKCSVRGCREYRHTASTWLSHQESHIFPFFMYDVDDNIGLGVVFYFAMSDTGEEAYTRSRTSVKQKPLEVHFSSIWMDDRVLHPREVGERRHTQTLSRISRIQCPTSGHLTSTTILTSRSSSISLSPVDSLSHSNECKLLSEEVIRISLDDSWLHNAWQTCSPNGRTRTSTRKTTGVGK